MQLYVRMTKNDSVLQNNLEKLLRSVKENGRLRFLNKNEMCKELLAMGIQKFREENLVKEKT